MIVFKPRNEISSENNPSDLVKKKSLSEKDEDVPVLVSDWFDHPLGMLLLQNKLRNVYIYIYKYIINRN